MLAGGDSAGTDFESDGPFFTYVVFRSFRKPPELQRYDDKFSV